MKKALAFILLGMSILQSCDKNNQEVVKEIELRPNLALQIVVDSIVSMNKDEHNIYELFVHKESEYRGFMLLHIGTQSYYSDTTMVLSYFMSNGYKIRLYSGIESYFNKPQKIVSYGRTEGIMSDENHSLWGIYLKRENIIGVYSLESANPFLLIPSPPYIEE